LFALPNPSAANASLCASTHILVNVRQSLKQAFVRVFFVAGLGCAPAFAGTWSGYLVDASCYKIRQQDTNPANADDYVNRDRGLLVELCRPTKKSKHFTVVEENGLNFNLNSSGDMQAAQLIDQLVQKKAAKKKKTGSYFPVVVQGKKAGDTVEVSSISLER